MASVLLTRPLSPLKDMLRTKLELRGFVVANLPTSSIIPLDFSFSSKNALEVSTLLFTSSNGVFYFFEKAGVDLGNFKIICIGKNTKNIIQNKYGLPVAHVYDSAAILIQNHTFNMDEKVLLVQGEFAGNSLLKMLKRCVFVKKIAVYDTVPVQHISPLLKNEVENAKFDLVAFTSPSGFYNFAKHFTLDVLRKMHVACIGQTTKRALEEQSITVHLVPRFPDMFAECIIEYFEK